MTYLFDSAYIMHGKIAVRKILADFTNGAQFAKSFLVNAYICNEDLPVNEFSKPFASLVIINLQIFLPPKFSHVLMPSKEAFVDRQ